MYQSRWSAEFLRITETTARILQQNLHRWSDAHIPEKARRDHTLPLLGTEAWLPELTSHASRTRYLQREGKPRLRPAQHGFAHVLEDGRVRQEDSRGQFGIDQYGGEEHKAIALSLIAVAINSKFQDAMTRVLRKNGVAGRVAGTKIKSLETIMSKSSKKYQGHVAFVLDIVRCRCVFRDPYMLRRCYRILTQQYRTVRVKNLFDGRTKRVTFRCVLANIVFKTECEYLWEWFEDKHAKEECRRFIRNQPQRKEIASHILNKLSKSTDSAKMIVEVQLTLEPYTKFSTVRELCHDLFNKDSVQSYRRKFKVRGFCDCEVHMKDGNLCALSLRLQRLSLAEVVKFFKLREVMLHLQKTISLLSQQC